MAWDIDFITEQDFRRHVAATIRKYGKTLAIYMLGFHTYNGFKGLGA